MRTAIVALGFLAAFGAVEASAQPVNLTGRYRCVVACPPGFTGAPAYITQNGWAVNSAHRDGCARSRVDGLGSHLGARLQPRRCFFAGRQDCPIRQRKDLAARLRRARAAPSLRAFSGEVGTGSPQKLRPLKIGSSGKAR